MTLLLRTITKKWERCWTDNPQHDGVRERFQRNLPGTTRCTRQMTNRKLPRKCACLNGSNWHFCFLLSGEFTEIFDGRLNSKLPMNHLMNFTANVPIIGNFSRKWMNLTLIGSYRNEWKILFKVSRIFATNFRSFLGSLR